MKKPIHFSLYFLPLLGLLWNACTKEEFMPPPIGEPVPDGEFTETYLEALESSPYTLFLAAWKNSRMDSIMNARGDKAPFTLLVPSNEAFEAAGLDLQTLQAMETDDADTLLAYLTLTDRMIPNPLETSLRNKQSPTLLTNPNFRDKNRQVYQYSHFIDLKKGQLTVDGASQVVTEPILVKYGTIWPVDRFLRRPEKSMLQVLKEDGRFGIFLEVCRLNDSTYQAIFGNPYNYTPSLAIMDAMPSSLSFEEFKYFYPSSVLAPTDEAFYKAGFSSAKEFAELNNRTTETSFYNRALIASDSILVNHFFGAKTYTGSGLAEHNPLLFCSNEMYNELLWDYPVFYEYNSYNEYYPLVKMPLDFIREGDAPIRIRVKGSSHEPATVVNSDIITLNGPLHVVDRLLIPEEFKLTP